MDSFFIRPACPGADIRDPETGDRLPDKGQDKPRTPHWIALQIRGDVVEGAAEESSLPPSPVDAATQTAKPKTDKSA